MKIAGLVIIVLGLITGIVITSVRVDNLGTQIDQVRGRLAAQQRASQQTEAALNGQLISDRAAFAQAEARIGGTHRDLITCSDWSGLFLPVSGSDSFGGQLTASAGPASLPAHCINQ